jgi:hypothetical protein
MNQIPCFLYLTILNYLYLGQRAEYHKYQTKGRAKSQMTKERIDKLESIGFQWRLNPETPKMKWEDRFEVRLLDVSVLMFALVPQIFAPCPTL